MEFEPFEASELSQHQEATAHSEHHPACSKTHHPPFGENVPTPELIKLMTGSLGGTSYPKAQRTSEDERVSVTLAPDATVANRGLDSTTTITTYYSTIIVDTKSSTTSEATQTGVSRSSISTTPVVLTRTTVLILESSAGTINSPPTTAPSHEVDGHRNQAWIAGPVLGSLAGAALILTTAIFLS
ncbi:hypothetical protein PG993_014612 [Apiospora rasikravindrae]|uniref:Uncharacterized protein n=1 Tax=Apiospora rasikravindrae TaxID=990691 RepID=A0ABR1RN97_9PEZI